MRRSSKGRHAEVLKVVRDVRRRWRLRVALRGMALVLGLGFLAFVASALGMDFFRFSEGAVTGFRLLAYASLLALLVWFLIRPLLRRVSDQQVALYLEEHEPSLEASLLSALELGDRPSPGGGTSPELLENLVRQAVQRCRAVEFGRRVESRNLRTSTGALALLAGIAALALAFGPPAIRNGVSALLFPVRDAAAVNPYSIRVLPGDTTIARNSDQPILAELEGFDATDVELLSRSDADGEFRRLSMIPSDSGRFEILLLEVADRTEYFVRSSGVRSATFTIDVADLPYVQELQLVYHFPGYTGLPPRTVEGGGDVAALAGTRVQLVATPTITSPGGTLWVDEDSIPLTPGEDGTLGGSFTVRSDGYYRIGLMGPEGTEVEASPRYTIDVLSDQPPAISFNEPGRDVQASPLDEVFVEARADDDFGVGRFDLVYSVNGSAEDTVALYRGGASALGEVVAAHTFFLEEWDLEPGDIVSYYATVRDNNAGRDEIVTSDIYFIQARPFGRNYRQAEQGGPPQGGGGAALEGAMAELQRQVIAATFNLVRDRDRYDDEAFRENLVSVELMQSRLREQVETLARRMDNRGVFDTDPRMQQIGETLPLAAEAMREAEERLAELEPKEALPAEQRALQLVLKAEETFERTVGQQQGGGGGGGGAQAEELADLFELELDKLKNQYETVQRGEQRQQDNQIDEALEKLKELARRQQQEAERQRRRAAAGQQAGGASRDAQRALADEAEEAARELQRLARENGSRELEEVARELQDAASAMRRSAGAQGNAGTAEAQAALDRLEEAQRRLQDERDERLRRDVEDARSRVDELARQQERVREEVAQMQRGGFGGVQQLERLMEQKDAMFDEVSDIERQLDQASAEALRQDQRQASERLQEAATGIRDDKLKEKIRFSKGVAQERDREYAEAFEQQIAADIGRLRDRLEEAEASIGEPAEDRMAEALDRTRELVQGMESMGERLEQAGRSGGQGSEGQQAGDQGRGGDRGQEQGQDSPGQRGRDGEAGERRLESSDQPGARSGRGGQQTGGRPTGDPTGGQPTQDGARDTGGGPAPIGGSVGADRWADLSPNQIRQFRSEVQRRERDARELRNLLRDEGREVEELDDVISSLEALQRTRVYGDPVELARLQDEVVQGLKRFEFALRRDLEAGSERVFLGGSDEVPADFRELVEEYYRALSRDPGR